MKVKLLAVSALVVCIAAIVLVLSVVTACCPWRRPTRVPSTPTPELTPQVVIPTPSSITNIHESKAKISGYLYSAETQSPLAGVTLTLCAKETDSAYVARSDALGYYEFVFNSKPTSFFTPGTITTSGSIAQPWARAAFTVMYSQTHYENKKNMHQLVYIYEKRRTDWGWQPGNLAKVQGLHQWFVLQPPKDQPLLGEPDTGGKPLVFVHGHGGTAGTWTAVRATLEALGYQTWEVHYGSSDPIVECAAVISDAVQTVLDLGGDTSGQVDMVTHSQGGAVARAYVSGMARYPYTSTAMPYDPKVRKLLQLAPPNFGILNGYRVEYDPKDTLCDQAVSFALRVLNMLNPDEPVAADLSLASTFFAELSHRPRPLASGDMLIVAGTEGPIPAFIPACWEAIQQNDLAVGASSSSLLSLGIPLGLIHREHTPIYQQAPVADVITAFLTSDMPTLKRSLDVYIDPGISFDDPRSWRVSTKGAEHDAFLPHDWDDRHIDTDFASGGLWLRIEQADGSLLVSGTVTVTDELRVFLPGYWPMQPNPESKLWLVDSNVRGFVLPVGKHFEYPYAVVAPDGPAPTKLGYVCIKPMQVISTTLSVGDDPPTICQVEESADPIRGQHCPLPQNVTVRAFVADDVKVDSVQLYLQPPGDSSWTPKEMSQESGSIYSVTIGPFSEGILSYTVQAVDSAGNETQSLTSTVLVTCTAPNGLDLNQLEKGDILMVNASPPVDLLLALYDGYWGHTAIYSGAHQVIEATTSGVEMRPIDQTAFWTAEDWVVKRANTTDQWRTDAVDLAQQQVDKPHNGNPGDKKTMGSYYSSQLVWRAYCGTDANCRIDLDTNWTVTRCKEVFPVSALCDKLADSVLPDDIYHDDEHLTEVQARQWDAKRMVVSLGSPADLYITDPSGRHVGVDPETNEVRQEIPEVSYYSGPDAEPEYVVITNMEGGWSVQVIGRGAGTYTLATEVIGLGDRAQIGYVTGSTTDGQRDNYTLTYPDTLGNPVRVDDTLVCPPAGPFQALRGPSPTPTQVGTLRFTDVADSALGANLSADAAAWGDYDGDGDLDLFMGGLDLPNRLFRNNGDGSFREVGELAGVADSSGARGAAFGDVDNDGYLDLIVANANAPTRFYRNIRGRTFTDASRTSGLDTFSAMAPLFADYDNDGYLDLYLTASESDALYHNDGDGTFTDITGEAEIHSCRNSLGAAWADYDNDGDQDLYIAKSHGQPSVLFRNNGDGTFTDVTAELGLADTSSGVAVAWGDYDNDGDLDLYLTNYGRQPSALYRNNSGRTFTDVAEAGVDHVGAGRGGLFADLDNDGYLDLFVVSCPGNVVYRNNGDGTFSDVTPTWGREDARCGQGAAAGDYDGDGYVDLFVVNDDGPGRLYRNSRGRNHWLVIKTEETRTNQDVIGARVSVCACGRVQTREVGVGTGWPSMDSLPVEFGLGSCRIADLVQVRWPSRARQRLTNVEVDRLLVVTEPTLRE